MKNTPLIGLSLILLISATCIFGQKVECVIDRKMSDAEIADATSLHKEGTRAYLSKNYEIALKQFTAAVERFPADYRSWNNLAVYYSDITKDYNKAITMYQHSICLNPSFSSSRMSLGTAYYYLKNYGDARVQLEKALELNPANVKARCNLSIVLIRLKKYRSAIKLLNEPARLPHDAIYINNLGAAYLYKKKYEQAAAYFKKAIEIDPKNTIFHFNLGIVYLSQKKKDLAVDQLKILRTSDAYRAELLYQGIYADKLLFVEDVIK